MTEELFSTEKSLVDPYKEEKSLVDIDFKERAHEEMHIIFLLIDHMVFLCRK